MTTILIFSLLATLAIVGVSMLASPETYAEQRLIAALRRPLACRLTGLALTLVALAGAAVSFIQFALSNYSE